MIITNFSVKDPKDMSKEELLALHEEDLKTIDMLREKIARARRNAPEFEPGSEVSVEALFDDKTLQENFSKLFKNVELYRYSFCFYVLLYCSSVL